MTSADIQQWVEELQDFRKRRDARRHLVEANAVEALIDCLDSTNESVVWAAVQSLEQLQAKEAIPKLIDLLESGRLAWDVSEALEKISGRKLGLSVDKWRLWLKTTDIRSSAPLAPEPVESKLLIQQVAELLGAEPQGNDKVFQFNLSLPGGRHQKVRVWFGHADAKGDELVMIYSECGPADPRQFEQALRINVKSYHGALGIIDMDGTPNFVMVDTLLATTLHPAQLAKCIENVAARADLMEKAITGKDER